MNRRTTLALALTPLALAVVLAGCSRAPRTAAEVIARSVEAHGGDRLTNWKTLVVKGTVRMQDGIAYNAAFLLTARQPKQVRVEQDMTADRGRIFYDYFLDDGTAWTRRNLVVSPYDAARMQRWLDWCHGAAFYARHQDALTLKPDADVTWTPIGPKGEDLPPMTRRAWVVSAKIGADTRELFFDKETFHFLKEVTPQSTRVSWDFAPFGGVVWPTRMLETTKTRQGESVTPFVFASVTYDAPVENWIFTEDKPARK